MALVKEMPVAPLAALVGEDDMRIWRIAHYYVEQAVEAQDLSGTEHLGIDDISFRRGQDYVSVFCDLDPGERRAVFVTEGRDQQTVEQFAGFLKTHGGDPKKITEVCQGMSEAYLSRGAQAPSERGDHVRSLLHQAAAEQGDRRGPPRGVKAAQGALEEHALPVAQAAEEPHRQAARLAR